MKHWTTSRTLAGSSAIALLALLFCPIIGGASARGASLPTADGDVEARSLEPGTR